MSDLRGYTQTNSDEGNKTVRLIAAIIASVAIIAAGTFAYRAVASNPTPQHPSIVRTSSVPSVEQPA